MKLESLLNVFRTEDEIASLAEAEAREKRAKAYVAKMKADELKKKVDEATKKRANLIESLKKYNEMISLYENEVMKFKNEIICIHCELHLDKPNPNAPFHPDAFHPNNEQLRFGNHAMIDSRQKEINLAEEVRAEFNRKISDLDAEIYKLLYA
jgi:hypothetical protein